jgi:parallel beta-helix repeat protein
MRKYFLSCLVLLILLGAERSACALQNDDAMLLSGVSSHAADGEKQVEGFPQELLALQSTEKKEVPPLSEVIPQVKEEAAKIARGLLIEKRHGGRQLIVPDMYQTITLAMDNAGKGDVIIVKPGIYYEQVVVKNGVKLISDSGIDGEISENIKNAHMPLPRRSLRTIIDGTKAVTSSQGIIDITPGSGRDTIVDGFTIRNLPKQNHHIPGHAHAVNMRGASAVIMNCLIHGNGSTGIGSHVIYADQDQPIDKRDFRSNNIVFESEPFIFNNVVYGNLGRGIGCNHFSKPLIVGNEVFANDDSEFGSLGPGIGAKHGAAPTIIGNIVHDNPGGGIMIKAGEDQGIFPVDRKPFPVVKRNIVFAGGDHPGISCQRCGSEETPAIFEGNYVYNPGTIGIGLHDASIAIIEKNMVTGSGLAGIAVNNSTVLKLNNNIVTRSQAIGLIFVKNAVIDEMVANVSHSHNGPAYLKEEGADRLPFIGH